MTGLTLLEMPEIDCVLTYEMCVNILVHELLLSRRISIAIQRSNAACILGASPQGSYCILLIFLFGSFSH